VDVTVKYLRENPKTGILEFRRAFPPELKPYATDDNGKRISELKRSLGVRGKFDLKRDGSKYRELSDLYDRLAGRALKASTGSHDKLDDAQIAAVADFIRHEGLAQDEEVRFLREPMERKISRARSLSEWSTDDLASARQLRALGDVEGMIAMWGCEAVMKAEIAGFSIDRQTESFARLCVAVNDAHIDVWEGLFARGRGDLVPTPPVPDVPLSTASKTPMPAHSERFFAEIAMELIEKRLATFAEPTKEKVRGGLRFLEEAVGNLRPSELTRERVTVFLALLAERPAKIPKEHHSWTLKALAAEYKDRPEVPRLSQKTVEAYSLALNARWGEAQMDGMIPETLASPFSNRKFSRKATGPKLAKGFSPKELTAYFSMPPFSTHERPKRGKGEAIYWIPLLMLYTGARPEEAAQLLTHDIFQHEDDGRWVIRFTDEGFHPAKGKQSLKTEGQESGHRTLPVPKALLDLGLLDYRQYLEDRGEVAMFPLLRRKGKRSGIYASFGEWMCDYIYDHGVLERGGGRQPVREFRHTWTSAARASKIPREAMEYIQGHRPPDGGSSHEVYGERHVLGNWIEQLAFKVDVAALVKPWKAPAGE